jgi:hypothetical protein
MWAVRREQRGERMVRRKLCEIVKSGRVKTTKKRRKGDEIRNLCWLACVPVEVIAEAALTRFPVVRNIRLQR